jgi:WD40 repeat protein
MAKLRLIACILDVRFDDLRQRHQERRARQLRYFSIAGAVLALLMAALAVAAAAFSPDGNRLLAGYTDGPVRLWELAKGKEIRCFTGHTQAVLAVTFADDGKLAASGSSDTTVRLWQIEQNQALATLTGHTGAVLSVASAGSLLVSGDGAVFLWDLSNQQRRLLGKADAPVTGVALAADGRSALSVTGAKTVL